MKTFAYDFQNGIFLTTDYDGSVTKTTANSDGRLTSKEQVKQGGNAVLKNVQHKQDRSEVVTDAAGNQTTVQRDEWFNIIRSTDGEGNVTRFSWNLQKRPTQITDPLGVVTKFEYDATGTLLLTKTEAVGTPVERITTYTYTEYGELETVTVDNTITTIAYDANGLPESITEPLGHKSFMEFDAEGNLKAVTDAEGNRTAMIYDDLGNVLTVTDSLDNQTKYTYNIEGRLEKVTDALARETAVETDFKGRILAVVDALQNRKEFDYDGGGNLQSITQGDATTLFSYDEQDRLTSVTDAENNTTTYAYADAGCGECGANNAIPETITDPFGNVTKNLFDKAGKVTGVQDPLTNLTNLAYDARGQVTEQIDGNGNVTEFKYDQLGRLTKQIDAESGETVFTYDKRDNLLTLIDPEQNTTTFAYDKANRKTKEIRPMGQETVYSYYDNGLLETVKDAKQQVTTYTYDKANRLTEITYADATKDTFGYDAVGNLTSYSNPDVSGTMTYDKLNRKLSETVDYGNFQKSFSYTYDARGNKATYTSPESLEHVYTYRKNDQLESIAVDGGTFSFVYDKSRLVRLTFPNGVTTDYGYNQNSWLTSIRTNGPNGNILTRNYTHDSVGNIGSKETEHGLYQYGYDKTYQLTSSDNPTLQDEAYSYDKVGNRQTSASTSGLWSYNGNNELISDSAATYEYDANGNTIKKTEGSQVTIYEYSAGNRLSKVYLPDGRQATYTYDPFGRRIKKRVANTTTTYIYDQEDITAAIEDDGVTVTQTDYIHGLGIDEPLAMIRDGETSYYHADGLGSIVAITDDQGDIVQRYSYEAFGQLTASDPTFDNFYTYTGREYDKETGLYYYRARYYDAMEGRFISKDPVAIGGNIYTQGVNVSFSQYVSAVTGPYTYTGNDPINFIDPFGLFEVFGQDINLNVEGGYQAGVQAVLVGLNGTLGGVVGTDGQRCGVATICARLGPGIYAGGGLYGAVGGTRGNTSNVEGWTVGGGGDAGWGPAVGGQGAIGPTNASIAGPISKVKGGGGWGANAGIDFCYTFTFSCSECPDK